MKRKALLIAEKPSLMRSIKEAYENHINEIDYDITFLAQAGHIITLLKPNEMNIVTEENKYNYDLPIEPDDLECGWQYKVIPGKEDLLKKIKSAIQSDEYEVIIHAGDPDQEGQLLVDIVLKLVKAKKHCSEILRYWSNDTTEVAVIDALKSMKSNEDIFYRNLYYAGLLRQHWDWRIGMNGSTATMRKVGSRASVGRVKTEVMNMVDDREIAIANFKPTTTYGVKAIYNSKDNFTGNYFIPNNACFIPNNAELADETSSEIETDTGIIYFDTENEANNFIKSLNKSGIITDIIKKQQKTSAPALYTMSSLQIDAASAFGYDPKQTLTIVQSLYDKKYMSYPRTDCALISSHTDFNALLKTVSCIPELANYCSSIDDKAIEKVKKTKKYVNDKEMAKHGHTGLTPTSDRPNLNTLTSEELNIYKMVCKRFLSIFLPPLIQDLVTIIVEVKDHTGNIHTFKSTGKKLVSKGFTEIFNSTFNDAVLPDVNKNEPINIEDFNINTKTTTCPKPFTKAGLIQAMEHPLKYLYNKDLKENHKDLCIGTNATRADIIETLISVDGYLSSEKNGKTEKVSLTPSGKFIISNLKGLDICKVDTTAEWENILSEVRLGNMDFKEAEKISKKSTYDLVKSIESLSITGENPDAKKRKGSKNEVCDCPCGGKIIATEKNYFCNRYKEGCKVSLFKENPFQKYTLSATDVKSLIEKKGTIKKTLTKKDGTTWSQKLEYDFKENKIAFHKSSR